MMIVLSSPARGRSFVHLLLLATAGFPVLEVPHAVAQGSPRILEEITVTAQRREQSADDIAIAIKAFSGEELQNLGIVDVTGLALYTPGMTVTETGVTGVPVYTIRGVGFDDYSSNSTATVGIYEDEVSLPYPTMTRGPQFDLARVEVLKGPQGTLYGRNTTGGAINLVSNAPQETFAAAVIAGYDRFGTLDTEGFITGPLSDRLRGRVALRTRQSDEGWQQSSSRPGDTLGAFDQWAGRVLLNWTPTDTLDVDFKASAYRDESENLAPQYNSYVPLVPTLAAFFPPPPLDTRPDPGNNRSADWSASLTPQRDNEGEGYALTLNWRLPGSVLTVISAYNHFERSEVNDWDGSFVENLDVIYDSEIAVFSQEIRLASDTEGPLQWLAGLYYADDEVTESWKALGSASTIYQGAFGTVDTRYEQNNETWAAFGQLDWNLGTEWSVSLGLRYTEEERDFSACSYDVDGGLAFVYAGFDQGPIPGFADNFFLSSSPLQAGDCVTIDTGSSSFSVDPATGAVTAFAGQSGVFRDEVGFDDLSGRVAVDWTPTDSLLLYASISDGFKSGGYNGAASSTWAQLEPYAAEDLIALELGAKASFLDGALRMAGAVFQYDYQDKQVLGFIADDVFGTLTQIVNVPESTVRGAELEVDWQLSERFLLRGNASYLDSEIEEFVGLNASAELQNYEGNTLAQTPEWQLGAQLVYEQPLGSARPETANFRGLPDRAAARSVRIPAFLSG